MKNNQTIDKESMAVGRQAPHAIKSKSRGSAPRVGVNKNISYICLNTHVMLTKTIFRAILVSTTAYIAACNNKPADQKLPAADTIVAKETIRNDWKKYYDKYNVTGSFVLYSVNDGAYSIYNKEDVDVASSPASTFKIPNSLINIELGTVKDENEVIKWDGVKRRIPAWNADTDLKNAYKNSTVWFYQELARRVGAQRMKEWVDKINYGNKNTGGAVDMFWLNDSLKISPMQQIDFLTMLAQNKLPFSQRTTGIMRKVMIAEDTTNFTLRAKTGWAMSEVKNTGWYVGYVETGSNTYVFANRISSDTSNTAFAQARIAICYDIFKDIGIYKEPVATPAKPAAMPAPIVLKKYASGEEKVNVCSPQVD